MIDHDSVVTHCDQIFEVIQKEKIDLRFFEIVTMIAMLEFRRKEVEYAVFECGIGGKLDATNIIDKPVCSAITTIGLDHMDVIGSTEDEIAAEKSGVIKTGIPCVVGPSCSNK